MAHIPCDWCIKDGRESGSSRMTIAVKMKDLKRTTSSSSPNASSRSKSPKSNVNSRSFHGETNLANLRRTIGLEAEKKSNISTPCQKTSNLSSQKSTLLENHCSIPSGKKQKIAEKGVHQGPARKSKRIKDDSTCKKDQEKQVSVEGQNKNTQDQGQHLSWPSKKRKRLDAESYREYLLHQKQVLKEAKLLVVRRDEENASRRHPTDVNINVVYDEVHIAQKNRENWPQSAEGANEVLESSAPGSHKSSLRMLEKHGHMIDDVKMDVENASERHVDDVNIGVACEENCNVPALSSEDVKINKENSSEGHVAHVNAGVAYSDEGDNGVLRNSTASLDETSVRMLEKDGLETVFHTFASFSEHDVGMDNENTSEGHVVKVNADVANEQSCDALASFSEIIRTNEENPFEGHVADVDAFMAHSDESANDVLRSSTHDSQLLEKEGLAIDVDPTTPFLEELSVNEHGMTKHAEAENISSSISSPQVAASQHLGDVPKEVNANKTVVIAADSNTHLVVLNSTDQSNQATLSMHKEVEHETYLICPSGHQSLAPLPQQPVEVEQPVMSDAVCTQLSLAICPSSHQRQAPLPQRPIEVEQPVMSDAGCTQLSLAIYPSSHQNLAPLPQRPVEVEQSVMSGVVCTQLSLASSEMQPSTSVPNVHAERIFRNNKSQTAHRTMHGSAQFSQIFQGGPMMDNYPSTDDEPLRNKLRRLRINIDILNREHEQKNLRLQKECNKKIENIRRTYESLLQEEYSTYLQKRRALNEKVLANQSLADDFQAILTISEGGAPSPPIRQLSQAIQQVPMRSLPMVPIASPIASIAGAQPPIPTSLTLSRPRVQTSQVAGLSFSSWMVQSSSSVSPGNFVRSTASPFRPYTPAPHFQCSRSVPPIYKATADVAQHSMAPTDQQLAGLGDATRRHVPPLTQVNLTAWNSHTVLPTTLAQSSSKAVPIATASPSVRK